MVELFKKVSAVITLVLLVGSVALTVWSLFLGPQWLMFLVGLCFVAVFGFFSYVDYKKYFKS